ncbi:MAG: hypothetical protein KDJ38_03170 [Gammaproteobacteria bacterium]|nr:hypothetical protein [Gammaproteobacteria bacterium]
MSKFQILAVGVILFIGLFIATYLVFHKPIPYAYDNLPSKLNQAMHRNGVHWAKVVIEGDRIYLSGTAPSDEAMVYAKSLIQKEAGVSADFIGIRQKSIKTKDDDEKSELDKDSWEEFKKENPEGRFQLTSEQLENRDSGNGRSSPKTGAEDETAAPTNKRENPVDDKPGTLEYRVRFTLKSADCPAYVAPPAQDVEILFREATPAMIAESLGALDQLIAYNRECPGNIAILSHGHEADQGLRVRRLDEIRYHLMSAGVEANDIRLQQ